MYIVLFGEKERKKSKIEDNKFNPSSRLCFGGSDHHDFSKEFDGDAHRMTKKICLFNGDPTSKAGADLTWAQ